VLRPLPGQFSTTEVLSLISEGGGSPPVMIITSEFRGRTSKRGFEVPDEIF